MSTSRACPTDPGATVGRRRRLGGRGGQQEALELAVESFNGADAAKLVGGLMRTLGEPRVSIGAAAGSSTEMRVTVAWELTWYQWCVDLERGPAGVSLRARGTEISELDGAARVWNGGASPGGVLHLGRAPRRRAARRRRRLF
jgi:hypothetical protein